MSAEMKEALAKIDQVRIDITTEFKGLFEKFDKELKRGESSTELANLSTRMDKEVAPKIAMLDAMEKSIKDTQAAVAEIEKSRQAKGDKSFTARPGSRPGRSLALEALNSEKAKRWRSDSETGGSGKLLVNVKHIWTPGEVRSARGYGARNLSQKADALTWDGDSVGDGVTPQYREGIIEIAQYIPILRKYIPIMTTLATDSVKTDVEKYDRELAGKLTADKNIGSTSFVLDYVDGWSATPPFNKIILNNGSAFEELTIQSVTAATKTIVTTAPSTIAMGGSSPCVQRASGLSLTRWACSSMGMTSARAFDCSRRKPVIQPFLPCSARASGSTRSRTTGAMVPAIAAKNARRGYERKVNAAKRRMEEVGLDAKALDEHARTRLDERNVDHILAAMECGLVSDVIAIARAWPVGAVKQPTWSSSDGVTHRLITAPTLERRGPQRGEVEQAAGQRRETIDLLARLLERRP